MLINVKMPTIVGILTFMSRINFVLSGVEYEKSFITSVPGYRGFMTSLSYHHDVINVTARVSLHGCSNTPIADK